MSLSIAQLVELLTHGGSVAVIALLYIGYTRERDERLKMTGMVLEMTEKQAAASSTQAVSTSALAASTSALASHVEALNSKVDVLIRRK